MAFINALPLTARTTLHRPNLTSRPPIRIATRPRAPQMLVVDAGSIDDMDKILANADDALVVVDFSTSWCGPCKVIAPVFDEMSTKYDDVIFVKVMGDATPAASELMRREGITAVPAFHFWKQDKKIKFFTGAKADDLEKNILQLKED